jgi:sugar/nucleoside kinase (ribokinase family)
MGTRASRGRSPAAQTHTILAVITVTGPSYLDVLMRVPHLAQEGEKVRGVVVRESPGGGAMNTAAWLAHEGASVRLVTTRGADSEGDMLTAACDGVGLHVDWVPCARTARALVLVPKGGERTIYTGHLHPPGDDEILDVIGTADTGITWSAWRETELRAAAAAPGTVRATDARAIGEDAAGGYQWDLYMGSLSENPGGVSDADLDATGARWCILTDGARGGRVWERGVGWRRYAVAPLADGELADTCGAGDSFAAGVLMALDEGTDIMEACARGAQVAARCLRQVGSFPGGPPGREPVHVRR